jgi:type I restriction enzyme S subunit
MRPLLVPSDGVRSEWVELCLRSEKTRQLLVDSAREVARKTLNLEQVREYAVPIPSEIEQVEAISRVNELLSTASEVELALGKQAKALAALRQSILKAAFSGELLPQEFDDEPAAVLIERIAAERRATEGTLSPRRSRKRGVTV